MSKETVSGKEPTESLECSVPNTNKRLDGQYVDHWVLSEEERQKGFIRPVREVYLHEKCNTTTKMPYACAETYARQPNFYGSTFCCHCCDYFPVGINGEFVWQNTKEKVGT